MRALLVGVVLAAAGVGAAVPVFEEVPVASACSCPDCDAFRDSPVVVRGTLTGWDFERDASGQPIEQVADLPYVSEPENQPRVRRVFMALKVATVYRGSVPEDLVVTEELYDRYIRAEGSTPYPGFVWPGESGVCFGIGADPTGIDLMIALEPYGQPGQYRIVALPFPFDDGSGRWFAERFPSLGGPYPPAAGNSPVDSSESQDPNDWMFVSAIGAGVLLFTLVALMVGPRRDRKP